MKQRKNVISKELISGATTFTKATISENPAQEAFFTRFLHLDG